MRRYKIYLLVTVILLFLHTAQAKTEYCSDYYKKQNISAFKVVAFHAFDRNNLVIGCADGLSGADLPLHILSSKDGGKSWQNRWSSDDVYLSKIIFLSRQIGFAAGAEFSDNRSNALILKTTDGGLSWKKTFVELAHSVEDIQFMNALNGQAMTEDGSILATTDGGNNWKIFSRKALNARDISFSRISFENTDSGWALSRERQGDSMVDGEIYQTRDGGKTWTSQTEKFVALLKHLQPTKIRFEEIKFFDSKTGYAAAHFEQTGEKSADGTRYLNFEGVAVFSSSDGGLNWKVVTSDGFGAGRILLQSNKIFWVIPTYVWQLESVFSTPDFGKTWSRQSTEFTNGANPSRIYFTDDKIGFLVADLGMTHDNSYRTLDAGKTWKLR